MKKTTPTRGSALLVGTAVMALAVSACGGDSGSGGGSDGPIKLALVAPLTGSAASYGLEVQQGIDLAVKTINADGGVDGRKIEVDTFDDKCSPTDGATAANAVVSRDYAAVVGQVCSVAVQSAVPIYKRYNMPIVAAAASSPTLADLDYEGFNRVIPADDITVANAVKLAVALDLPRLGVLYPADDYGQALAQVVKDATQEYGAEAVAMESYTPGQTNDYSPLLANIAQADPDAFFLGGYDADMGAAVKQSTRAFGGQEFPIVSNNNVQTDNFIKLAGAAGEGAYIIPVYAPEMPTEGNAEFVKAFEDEYGKTPGTQGAMGWQSIQVIKEAVKANDGSTEDLMKAIRSVSFESVAGPIEFDENGDNIGGSSVVLRLQGGKWVVDEETSAAMAAE
jgi:branched-chain amino acid transport system substrate-binding protein